MSLIRVPASGSKPEAWFLFNWPTAALYGSVGMAIIASASLLGEGLSPLSPWLLGFRAFKGCHHGPTRPPSPQADTGWEATQTQPQGASASVVCAGPGVSAELEGLTQCRLGQRSLPARPWEEKG